MIAHSGRYAPGTTPGLASPTARGNAPPGLDLQLTQYDERGWRATFYTTGMEHSPTSVTGTGWERTPWQRAGVGGIEDDRGGRAMNLPRSRWCQQVVALAFVLGALPPNVFAQVPVDRDTYDVCALWEGVLRQVNGGVVTGSEIRTQLQAVHARAHRTLNRELRYAATAALLRAATDTRGGIEASQAMTAACRDHPAFSDAGRPASSPITDDEATRHLRRVLERAGEADAKCQQKQYGPAWVAVCE
jgi:hypothetical protein